VSDHHNDETDCPFCHTKFLISDVADPTSISARKYKRQKKPKDVAGDQAQSGQYVEESLDILQQE
jgi:hypothetical protein